MITIDLRDMKKLGFDKPINEYDLSEIRVKLTSILTGEFVGGSNDIIEVKIISKNLYYRRKWNNPTYLDYTKVYDIHVSDDVPADLYGIIRDSAYTWVWQNGERIFNHQYKETEDGYIVTFKKIKYQVVNELINIKYEKFPMTLILTLSARVITRGNKELADPKTNPKMNFMARLMTVKPGGGTHKKSVVLNIKDGKLYWKNAPFTAHNVEFFEEKLKEIL